MQRIKVVLPAYNEADSLPSLLRRLEATKEQFGLNMEVLVVNDGSTDDTLKVAQNFEGNITVKAHDLQPNRGLAGAIRAGLTEGVADMEDTDILFAMDADDSHPPGLINRMVNQIREGSDIVIASRYQPGSRIRGLTKFRELMSVGASWMFQIMAGIEGVRDYTCGFRGYRVSLVKQALEYWQDQLIEQKGFGCMAELLLKMNRFKPIINEVPFILRYDQKQGASKMRVASTVGQTLKMLFGYTVLRRFRRRK